MGLTPLKIKGKGPRPKTWTPPDPTKLKRKRQQEDGTLESARKLARRRRPALIEQLPTEILEQIFFLSENLDFPRSSLRIGRIFSHPSALVQLTVAAFSPTWKLGLGCNELCSKSQRLFLELSRKNRSSPAFESAVLACPWMTVAILDKAQQVFRRRDKSFELRHRGNDLESACQSARKARMSCETLDVDLDILLGLRQDKSQAPPPKFPFRQWREIHPSTLIPNHLYTGPFDNWEKVKLLFWLIRAGATFPRGRSSPQSWKLSKRGFDHLMSLEDDPAKANLLLQLFFRAGVFFAWPVEERFWEEDVDTFPDHIDRHLMERVFVDSWGWVPRRERSLEWQKRCRELTRRSVQGISLSE